MYSVTLAELERLVAYVPDTETEIIHKLNTEIDYLHSIDTREQMEIERQMKMNKVFDRIETMYGLKRRDICRRDNTRNVAIIRQCVMTYALQNGFSLREAGAFVQRDHSTAYYSQSVIHANLYGFNKQYTDIFNSITECN